MADVLESPTERGLADVAALAKATVKSAALVGAHIAHGRYVLTFTGLTKSDAAKEKALDEMEDALNRYRIHTSDTTGLKLVFR